MSSLRRRWNRAFASLFALGLLGSAASTVVVTHLVREARTTAEEVQEESHLIAALRQALREQESLAHGAVDKPEEVGGLFLAADRVTEQAITEAEAAFNDPGERSTLADLRVQWNATFGSVRPVAEGRPSDMPAPDSVAILPVHARLSIETDKLHTALEHVQEAALAPVAAQLEDSQRQERRLLIALYTLVGLGLLVTVYYARRIRRDVLDPISKFREATGTVGAGNLRHRVELDRNDEFGELAATFNTMAEALDDSQRQLEGQVFGLARLAAIVESSDQSIVGMDPDLAVTTWNPGAERLYGYAAEEAVGRNIFELLLPEHRDATDSPLHRVAAGARISGYETEVRSKNGRLIPISVSASPIRDESGAVVGLSTIGEDIGRRKALEERLHHQAFHDSLTGLANRALLQDRLEHALTRQKRNGGLLGVVLLDLDDFKAINDSLGHRAGDELLISVADRLRGCTREADTLARLGGDEFAILLEDLESAEDAFGVANRIVTSMGSPFTFEGQVFPVSASLGIALAEGGNATLDDVIRDADVAMYLTKGTAKGSFTVFEAGMHLAVKERLRLKADLAKALGTDELSLHYQPIVDLPTGDIVGVEALARWTHPESGPISPLQFIPVAEESGLIVPLGLWVLETACRDVLNWQNSGEALQPLRLSVNVSGRQLEDPYFVDSVRHLLGQLQFDPRQLVLEITETVLVTKADESIEKLHQLKSLGVQLAIDDFGTGYSSLSSLQRLPVDIVKIDRSFISHLDGDDEQADLARAVLGLGRTLQLQTVAEGVETDLQATELRRLECGLAQGYYFARPGDRATLSRLLQGNPFPLPTPA